ncbi:MAG TPA: NAD(P)H-hydrate dehydratase [Planctomycetaceae bacterium]|nr:NAD(P)H-hydrate dehydratase [Planctomycetaceae bacterium]
MSGSISLSAMAALRAGSGLVSALVPDCCLETVAAFDPCIMTIAAPATPKGQFAIDAYKTAADPVSKSDVIAIGPGMGTGPGGIRLVRRLAMNPAVPRVFDADALNVIARTSDMSLRGPAVLTPHPGEMQRLSGVSAKDRAGQIEAACEYARSTQSVLLLKGSQTFITDGQSRWFNSTGNPGMASGGSGDCLTGIIASLLGQGHSPWDAARLGAYIHGLAGDLAAEAIGEAGMVASDLIQYLPNAIGRVTAPSHA